MLYGEIVMIIVNKEELTTKNVANGMVFEKYQELFSYLPNFKITKKYCNNILIENLNLACEKFIKVRVRDVLDRKDAYRQLIRLSNNIGIPFTFKLPERDVCLIKTLLHDASDILFKHIRGLIHHGHIKVGVSKTLNDVIFTVNRNIVFNSYTASALTAIYGSNQVGELLVPTANILDMSKHTKSFTHRFTTNMYVKSANIMEWSAFSFHDMMLVDYLFVNIFYIDVDYDSNYSDMIKGGYRVIKGAGLARL